jgi:hypothetical protein
MAEQNDDTLEIKKMIIDKANKGVFNRNPLLNTLHHFECINCKTDLRIVYLNYLKSGEFELGQTEEIEVLNPQGVFTFLEKERVTPIVIKPVCRKCGAQIKVQPLNVEYLLVIINRPKSSSSIYV